jgi:hypothetical protein
MSNMNLSQQEQAEQMHWDHAVDAELMSMFARVQIGTMPWDWTNRKHRMIHMATCGLSFPDRGNIRMDAGCPL